MVLDGDPVKPENRSTTNSTTRASMFFRPLPNDNRRRRAIMGSLNRVPNGGKPRFPARRSAPRSQSA
jgi:hypothetical protein